MRGIIFMAGTDELIFLIILMDGTMDGSDTIMTIG